MTNGQVEKMVEVIGYVNKEMQTLNRTLHDIDLTLSSMESSFDEMSEGLDYINEKLDKLLKYGVKGWKLKINLQVL